MNQDVLIGFAEVSVVLAGFSGISVILSRRQLDQWSFAEAARMTCMIESSLTAAFFAILPIAISSFGTGDPLSWGLSSAILALVTLYHMILNARRMRRAYAIDPEDRLPIAFRAVMALIGFIIVVILILNSLGVIFDHSAGPYFAGLLFHLAFAGLMFMRSLTAIRDVTKS